MNIENDIINLLPQMRKDKHFFWNNPENEFEEIKTSNYIVTKLKEMGYENIKTNIAKTGVVAQLDGTEPGECILFRADMDAVMMDDKHRMKHTCGHDAHMTILLGLAQLLINNKNRIKGCVKLLFQPAEEGHGGARPMINEGVLENSRVDKVFALHVWSEIDEGKIGIREGAVMASTDPFDIKVIGKGGHAALPEKCVDPIYIASSITIALQGIVGRNINPNDTAVVGITSINGGSTNNVIPDKVELKGICRTFNNELRKELLKRIENVAMKIAESMNGSIEFKHILEYPAVVNSKSEAEDIKQIAKKIVGEDNIVTDYRTMCAEDFSFFLQERPGAFVLIGNRGENVAAQHNEDYLVSEKSILIGEQVLYEIAKKYLFK
ncbi:MAG: amidohydrolase [Clostridia bacterium]|jgi:amidohydrolase|nr:amidohydrolase [Clostridia bacterium]